jgi:hypothetical protein
MDLAGLKSVEAGQRNPMNPFAKSDCLGSEPAGVSRSGALSRVHIPVSSEATDSSSRTLDPGCIRDATPCAGKAVGCGMDDRLKAKHQTA